MSESAAIPTSPERRRELLVSFLEGGRAFDHCVQSAYPAGLLDWRPDLADAWSVRSHLIHVVDAEIFLFTRFRLALAEPGGVSGVWDQLRWEANLDYGHQALTASLQVFKLLRSLSHSLLVGLPEARWAESWFTHPERGRLSLDQLLELAVNHVATHLDYVKRNENWWRESGQVASGPHGH